MLGCWGGFLNLLYCPYCFRLSADSAAGTCFQSYLQVLDTGNLCLTISLVKSGDRERNSHYLNSVNHLWNLLLRLPQNRVAVSSQPAGTAHNGVLSVCQPWFPHTIAWKTASTQVVFLDSDYWQVLLEHELPYCLHNEMLQKIINNKYADIYIFDVFMERLSMDRRRSLTSELQAIYFLTFYLRLKIEHPSHSGVLNWWEEASL